jgi:Rps23 Pro-64 3,4-dihydroxylase Tpa1-like proline 4-hydroxylase
MRNAFFIRELAAVEEDFEDPDATAIDSPWHDPGLLVTQSVEAIRRHFNSEGRIRHVCLTDVLRPELAARVYRSLERASFQRHHHGAYELSVARDLPARGSLGRFITWLASAEGARFHQLLVGWSGEAALNPVQVQVSSMKRGDSFPPHVDTDQAGLAAVYNFSAQWEDRFGGVLHFPARPRARGSERDELRVPPMFNSVFLFACADVTHRVTKIEAAAGEARRYTVTAFYLPGGGL